MSYKDLDLIEANQDYLIGTTTPAYPNGFQPDGDKDTLHGKSRATKRHDVVQPAHVNGTWSTYQVDTVDGPSTSAQLSAGDELVIIHEITVSVDPAVKTETNLEVVATVSGGGGTKFRFPIYISDSQSKSFVNPLEIQVPDGETLTVGLSPTTVGGDNIHALIEVCMEKEAL